VREPVTDQRADPFEIRDNREANRWEVAAADEDKVIAYAEYRVRPGAVAFTHTVVEPEYEGKGIGSRLARTVLDDAVTRGLRIVPYCPFIAAYLERHPEYGEHVDMPHQQN
jgi:predicted GNAT family acetyltransferase